MVIHRDLSFNQPYYFMFIYGLIRLLYYLPMEMAKEEVEKLKDFKVYAFEWDMYVKAEDYKKIAIENKKLREYADNLDSENDNQAIEIEELKKENKKLKKERDLYKARNEELNENCFWLAKENKKLKSDLAFERTMLDNVRAEYKSLQNVIKKLKGDNENLKAIIEHYKKFEEWKKKLEWMLMEEDTLQELRDIGEIE